MKEIKLCLEKSINFVWFLGSAMFAGIVGISSGLVYWYYGEGFGAVEPILIATTPIIMSIGFNSIFGVQYLVQVNKTKAFTISVVVGAIINFVLNFILIPIYGGLGAALASVVAETTIAVIQFTYLRKDVRDIQFLKNSWKPVFAGIVMFGVVKCLDIHMTKSIISTCIQIVAGVVIYLGIMYLCNTLKINMEILLNYLRKTLIQVWE